jgi:hypothetical protein
MKGAAMERRKFIVLSLGTVAATAVGRAVAEEVCMEGDVQSFGYYQGLGPNETRSPARSDGTAYQMPCVTADEIAAGEEKEYVFWHGHGAGNHRFVLTAEDFVKLQNGEAIEVYTNVVDGHRHALRVNPAEECRSSLCR